MTLRNGDYEIHGDSITIRKEVLENWHQHYCNVSIKSKELHTKWYFLGKSDDVLDLLKLFEELEP